MRVLDDCWASCTAMEGGRWSGGSGSWLITLDGDRLQLPVVNVAQEIRESREHTAKDSLTILCEYIYFGAISLDLSDCFGQLFHLLRFKPSNKLSSYWDR